MHVCSYRLRYAKVIQSVNRPARFCVPAISSFVRYFSSYSCKEPPLDAMEECTNKLSAVKDNSRVGESLETHDPVDNPCDIASMSHGTISPEGKGSACVSGVVGDPISLPTKYLNDERYTYLQQGFSSEIFKIEINNIPPRIGYKVFICIKLT